MATQEQLRAELDALLDSGERAAVLLDGDELDETSASLESWAGRLKGLKVDEDFLRHARERVWRYREMCSFVGETMHGAMIAAGGGDIPAGAGAQPAVGANRYAKSGRAAQGSLNPVLLKRVY